METLVPDRGKFFSNHVVMSYGWTRFMERYWQESRMINEYTPDDNAVFSKDLSDR